MTDETTRLLALLENGQTSTAAILDNGEAIADELRRLAGVEERHGRLRTAAQAFVDDYFGGLTLDEAHVRPYVGALNAFSSGNPMGTEPGTMLGLLGHLSRQIEFSRRTFGPGPRTAGLIDHIRKELGEIACDPTDLEEWIDVVILALDGAWRCAAEHHTTTAAIAEAVVAQLVAKQTKNEGRTWPDWRTVGQDKAIEHDRSGE